MIEYRASQHQSVEQGDGDADGHAVFHFTQHAAGRGTMDVEAIVFASVRGGDNKRLAVGDETNGTQETFVENAIRGFAIIYAALGFANDTSPRCGHLGLGHWGTTPASAKDG